MKQYLDLLREVLTKGKAKTDPQKVGNIALGGRMMTFDLADGFPLITTRSMKGSLKAMIHELLWFLSGSTNVADLNKHGVHLWDIWATKEVCEPLGLPTGSLGPIYGHQWRNFNGVDQVANLIYDLKTNPDSRRLIVSSWDPADLDKVFVAPCHCFYKFFHAGGELELHLFQRSADMPVGVPFNIAEYSLLLMMVAQVVGLKPTRFVHFISDCHIYNNQIEAVKEQLEREPRALPTVRINPDVKDIFAFRPEDFEIADYNPHPPIKIPVAL
jgi:thymidylate synthase